MTVKELIEKLKEVPEDFTILVWNGRREDWCDIDKLTISSREKIVEIWEDQ